MVLELVAANNVANMARLFAMLHSASIRHSIDGGHAAHSKGPLYESILSAAYPNKIARTNHISTLQSRHLSLRKTVPEAAIVIDVVAATIGFLATAESNMGVCPSRQHGVNPSRRRNCKCW